MSDIAEGLVCFGLVVAGLLSLALHPRKAYQLAVHGVGWYER